MRFYNRENELRSLEKAYQRNGADLIIISGRRRIGKSRLIEEFTKDKTAINVLIVPKEEKQVAKDIEDEIRIKLGYSPPFSSFRDAMEYLLEHKAELICFDEFPNTLTINKAIPYELQRLWDKYKEEKNLLLIISGSYVGLMNRISTAKKAPLFNRATSTIILQPLPLKTVVQILNDLKVTTATEQLSFYCIFGGIPYYYMLLEKLEQRLFKNAVESLFFDVGAQLRDEGENVLRQEFGNAYAKYYAILEAIEAGHVSMNEISQKVGVRSTTLSKYMKALQHDFRITDRIVPFGENPQRSKKGLYFIQDNTLAFWYSKVYGKRDSPTQHDLDFFISKRFEILCREFLADNLKKKSERVKRTGKWWGNVEVEKGKFEQRDIDVVVETEKTLYTGECKWTEGKVGVNELHRLQESSKPFIEAKKPVKFVLFSKNGFSFSESEDILLFDAERIARES
jgi:AAA+ ATPase superfamily predicted ATPase